MGGRVCGRPTRGVSIRGVTIGAGSPVRVQGMIKCDSRDHRAAMDEILALYAAGCEIVRVAVPDRRAAAVVARVIRESPIPVVADIHFDYRLALAVIEAGVDKLRVNPGNLGGAARLRAVAREAMARGIPIRVGVNSGSIERDILERHGGPTAEAMVESARRQVGELEEIGFADIVLSLKSSSVPVMIEAYTIASREFVYPLHVGVTETGAGVPGIVKSAVGIGALLAKGIGDTIRVSLTGPSTDEIRVGKDILVSLGLRKGRPEIISCPTCGRCASDIACLVGEVGRRLESSSPEVRVAIMGCEVNGPGEAKGADVGVAMGKGRGVIFVNGKPVKTVASDKVVDELCGAVEDWERSSHGEGRRGDSRL